MILSHEEVVNQLDNETVSYTVGLGVLNSFTDIFRVSIKVEIAHYETAIAWLKDLVYGSEFNKERYIYDQKNLLFMTYLIVPQVASRSGQDTAISSTTEKKRGSGAWVVV